MPQQPADRLSADHCSEMMKSLADPLRLRIVDLLTGGAMCVSDLATRLGAELANVSHHLGVLRHAGLIERRREGKFLIYQVREGVYQQGHLDFGCCRLELPESRKPARTGRC